MQESLSNVFKKIFGSRNDRILKKLSRFADSVEALEPAALELSDEALKAKTQEFRDRIAGGENLEAIMPEVFSIIREASRRAKNHRHFHCQLIGGRVLYEGNVAEMRTGEGKTIVCHLAAYMRVCQGMKVHIVTVNDYLVERDAEFARPIFEMLGVSVGYIQSQVDPGGREGIRQQAYGCDITYGTNSEFGFDYLRDNMKMNLGAQVQGPLDYVIIDEVDSILIDEARTPLIISGPAHDDVSKYKWADNIARMLVQKQQQITRETAERIKSWGDNPPEQYKLNPKFEDAMGRFRIDPRMLTEEEAEALGHKILYVAQLERKNVGLTHDGVQAAQDEAKIGSFYVGANMDRPHIIEQSLRAHVIYERDKDYVVQNREVIIVDEFTGRLMIGRQWSDGLHQAVEAKENVPVKEETQTMATITIQNFFKLYATRAGMTGTALTEADEFMKIYKLDVVSIPTNRPINRLDHNDKMFRHVGEKYKSIVEEIHDVHQKGRPADPFVLADVFKALKPIKQKLGEDTSRIDEAIKQFNNAEYGDKKVIQFMTEVYDDEMGDLATGRPVLVGTTSVENSEKISKLLDQTYGIEHEVLNAKNHAREADIVAKAGHRTIPSRGGDKNPQGNVTIATNMAGRGTDIKLELNVVYPKCKVPETEAADGMSLYPPGTTKCCISCEEYDPATNCAHCYKPKLDPRFPEIGRKVCSLNSPCGLHIIGTERHESRRIDNQLRGRAGRQGDPGSSRFFLSLEDVLLKHFMPDWMIKMMERFGFTEGTSLEDKRLSKGIERAQKKVEEINFGRRKSLIEWDEPMDYQRKLFYSERQRVLEGTGIRETVMRVLRDSVEANVERFASSEYPAKCISEWCRSNLDIPIEPDRIRGDDIEEIQESIRRRAISESREQITTSLGEYIIEDAPPEEWDVRGLSEWAQRTFNVNVTQNQLRKMDPAEISDWLTDSAQKHFESVELDGIAPYLEDSYPRAMLAEWSRSTFGIELASDELKDKSAGEMVETIMNRLTETYEKREVTYPVEIAMERSGLGVEGADSAYAAQALANWSNAKFRINRSPADFQGKSPKAIYDDLVAVNREFMTNGKLEHEIDEAVNGKSEDEVIEWAKARFGPGWNEKRFHSSDGELRERLLEEGREMLRYELSRMEQVVLLRIHDQCWKDHLLEMDHLKTAIMQRPMGGDQTHPQSQYAIEGREYFDEMWSRIRERVVDVILKVRMGGGPQQAPSAPIATTTTGPGPEVQTPQFKTTHADATNTAFAGADADQRAAMKAQGSDGKPDTIRREQPKVGRNDPCPCGSGKKYKQCHGRK
ncbi:MAG TPA: SEC-C metal-binding domain-containing protein [Phycisphaerae bacterium]|nr:SEC-C metal-binding domain-containing protein [Phycisphaerae bacterium]